MSFYYSENPVADAERYYADRDRELERYPLCSECEEHIQEETGFYINGEWICENCIEIYRRDVYPE